MKVEARVLDVESTLEGERIGMSIDLTQMPHLMSVLTDLYSDPELAVIREYSTNAFDAHVEAGLDRPIDITLPSPLAPYLKIRDYGEGLDVDDIRDIYSKYGASTKRSSNDVVGMLGLGCKSALTYTDQFTLTSTKDGYTTQVSVSRDEDGSGSMTVVDQYESDEEQGTEIVIPAKKYHGFEQTAKDFFRFWPAGSVLVNGEEPKRVDGLWIADDLLLTQEVEESIVVMGNVPYPMDESYVYGRNWFTVAFVPIGSVNFTPSRESLQFNAKTKATVAALQERVKVERDAALLKLINEAASAPEAVQRALAARSMEYKGTATYNGEEIPLTYDFDKEHAIVVNGVKKYRQKDWQRQTKTIASVWSKAVVFYGYKGDSFSPYKRKKLEQWWTANKNDTPKPEYFLLVGTLPRSLRKWLNKDQVISWAGPDSEKIVREGAAAGSRVDGRPTGSYEGYVAGCFQRVILAEDIDYSKGLYYARKNEYVDRNILNLVAPDATLIIMGGNRVNKFLRDFPMAQMLENFNRQQTKKWQDDLTDDDKLWLKIQSNGAHQVSGYDHTKIDDPVLARYVRLANEQNNDLATAHATYRVMPEVEYENPTHNYPLLDNLRYYCYNDSVRQEHVLLYVNAVYAAEGNQS